MARYHCTIDLEEDGYEMCRKPHPKISRRHLQGIITACSKDIRLRILDSISHFTLLLDRFYRRDEAWTYRDLQTALENPGFSRLYDQGTIFYDIPVEDMNRMNIDPWTLNLVRSFEPDIWSIPFIDSHALTGYRRQSKNLVEARRILNYEWHLCTSYDLYITSFSSLNSAKNYVDSYYPHEREMIIYHDDVVYASYP